MQTKGKILAQRAITRASSGLYFIDEIIRFRGDSTDGAFSRSWYVLLSFNFELILNSLIALESKGKSNQEVMKDIMSVRPAHDYEKLFQKISTELLSEVGLISIKKQSKNGFIQYEVFFKDGSEAYIQDLVDVRYDFKKDNLRSPDPNEIPRIKKESKSLRSVISVVKKLAWEED